MRRVRHLLLAGLGSLVLASQASAEELAFGQAPVSDADLSEQRGGFTLPGGLAVAIAVQSDTRVNGVLLLRTIFTVDRGPPTLSIFGRATGAVNEAAATATGAGAASTNTVTFGSGSTASAIGQGQEDLVKLDLAVGGAVEAAGGTVKLETLGAAGKAVTLSLDTLDVRHLVGQAYGTIAANRGNDVAIDTSTIINLDLQNVTPLNIGSSMFRVDALGMDAAAALGRR